LAQLDSLTQSIFIEMFGDPRENERGWSKASIGSLVSDMRGGAALEPEDFIESGFPVLHKGAIKPNGGLSFDPKKRPFTSVEYAEARPKNTVDRDFVAVTLRDLVPSGPSIGLATDLRSGPFDEYLLAQGAYGFRVDVARLTGAYVVALSNMPTFRYVLRQNAVGSTQIHIRTPIYLAIRIPVPPISLQQDFAARIQTVESLKAAHRSALAESDALFASLQHRAFAGGL
jgi:type I restriction enzyme S subunit